VLDEKNLRKFLDTATESIFIIKEKGKIKSSADVILAEILLRKVSQIQSTINRKKKRIRLKEQHVL